MSDSAIRLLPIRPDLRLADTPEPVEADGSYEVEFLVPEPGRYKFRMEGYPEAQQGIPSTFDPKTGNHLVSRLVNVVTGEVVFTEPLSPSALRYGPAPGPR